MRAIAPGMGFLIASFAALDVDSAIVIARHYKF
jgi:hypothetical protein